MKIQYVSKYLSLSKEGLVPELLCPMDQGSLYSNQDLQDNIFLYCISCSYKKTIGIVDYENLVDLVDRVINE
jgi:hypothetical protein